MLVLLFKAPRDRLVGMYLLPAGSLAHTVAPNMAELVLTRPRLLPRFLPMRVEELPAMLGVILLATFLGQAPC